MRLHAAEEQDLRKRTKAFALRIIRLYAALPKQSAVQILGRQVLRSGTSVGAHIAEANFAKSRADFINKLEGALQELEETRYWLELLLEGEFVKPARLKPLTEETGELIAILVTIVSRSRRSTSKD
ncbi:four helix bundle protein [bacterium]|nr:four helix bundle protein [bacterium]MBU1983222.1 four helix bundle protein [bacterium]